MELRSFTLSGYRDKELRVSGINRTPESISSDFQKSCV